MPVRRSVQKQLWNMKLQSHNVVCEASRWLLLPPATGILAGAWIARAVHHPACSTFTEPTVFQESLLCTCGGKGYFFPGQTQLRKWVYITGQLAWNKGPCCLSGNGMQRYSRSVTESLFSLHHPPDLLVQSGHACPPQRMLDTPILSPGTWACTSITTFCHCIWPSQFL